MGGISCRHRSNTKVKSKLLFSEIARSPLEISPPFFPRRNRISAVSYTHLEQLKAAQKEALEHRAPDGPKKKAPDRGDR